MKLMAFSLSLVALLGIASVANAQLAFDQTDGVPVIYGDTITAGYTFDVTTPLTVTELEMYADFGFQSAVIPVGIWDNSGTLLTSASISTTVPATITPSANGGSFFGVTITPITLTPGTTYTIGAFGDGNDTIAVAGTIIADPAVRYGNSAVVAAASLTKPYATALSIAAVGPSFKFTTVPEPGSVALLIGMASLGGMMLRRKRKQAAISH